MRKIIISCTILLSLMILVCSFNIKPISPKTKTANLGKNIENATKKKPINTTPSRSSSKKMLLHGDSIMYENGAVVLTYHHISDLPYSQITIKPERFEEDLKMLKNGGFNVITLREMINSMNGNGTMPDNAVVITFDDGIGSFYKYAYPLLQKYSMKATEFIITSRNEAYKPSNDDTNPLSPAQITEMYKSGLVDIQSHSNDSHEYVYTNAALKKGPKLVNRIYNKDNKTLESTADYDKRVMADLTRSSDLIYKYTGHYSDMLCLPFGIYNQHVLDLAKECGFKYFITTQKGVNKQDSKKNMIWRLRAGDEKLNSNKVYNSIIDITKGMKN